MDLCTTLQGRGSWEVSWMTPETLTLNGVARSGTDLRSFAERAVEETERPTYERTLFGFLLEWLSDDTFIEAMTSGSTGVSSKVCLKKAHMLASARMTLDYFHVEPGSRALLALPVTHIAGRMMVVRALVGGLDLVTTAPRLDLCWEELPEGPYGLSALVPSQVESLLRDGGEERLAAFQTLLIGGAPVSEALESRLTPFGSTISITYGMTESVSHVAVRQPGEVEGGCGHYRAMPGVSFRSGEEGDLLIDAPTLSDVRIATRDKVELKGPHAFCLIGRLDGLINSGGLKVMPERLECEIARVPALAGRRFFIVATPDKRFGECVTLVVESSALSTEERENLLIACSEVVTDGRSKPRKVLACEAFLESGTGKVLRKGSLAMALAG